MWSMRLLNWFWEGTETSSLDEAHNLSTWWRWGYWDDKTQKRRNMILTRLIVTALFEIGKIKHLNLLALSVVKVLSPKVNIIAIQFIVWKEQNCDKEPNKLPITLQQKELYPLYQQWILVCWHVKHIYEYDRQHNMLVLVFTHNAPLGEKSSIYY